MIYEFIDVLNQETEQYLKLIEVGGLKSGHLIKGNLKELGDINTIEGHIVSKVKPLERKRNELMDDIAAVLNLNKDTVTVTLIEGALEGQSEEANNLHKARIRLKAALDELNAINETNKGLVEQSLEYANFSINMLQTAFGHAPLTAGYGSDGEHRGNSVFDSKK
jgi:flagellar biosynthesis/type III secretory pathway chaperone